MPTVPIAKFVLGAATLFLLPLAAANAEPQVLTGTQLDGVTAGGVLVDVSTLAVALGDHASGITDTRTTVVGTEWLAAGLGLGMGQAFACCGPDSQVIVGSAAAGAGDRVHGGTTEFGYDNNLFALGAAFGWVGALSSPTREALIQALGRPARL